MIKRVLPTPLGNWLIEEGLEEYVPPMGYCAACGKGMFNEMPGGKLFTYCGCLGVGVPARRIPRRFCPGCGNTERCRCLPHQSRIAAPALAPSMCRLRRMSSHIETE